MSYAETITSRPPSNVCLFTLSILSGYQGVNTNNRFIESSRIKNLSFEVLTGQMSSSQWAIDQVKNQTDNLSLLAIFGTALLFSADARFKFEGKDTLVVFHPHMPDCIELSLEEGNSSINVIGNPSLAEALSIFGKGSIHMGIALIKYFAQRYRGIPPDAEILRVRRGEIDIRIIDEPAKPPKNWGGGGEPAKTHEETRVKFKDHYRYPKGSVQKVRAGSFW